MNGKIQNPVSWLSGSIRIAAFLFLMFGLTAPALAQSGATARNDFQTTAPNAILIEAAGGALLFEKNADQPIAPASLAKLMTVEVVLNEIRQGRLKLDDEFQVSADAWKRGGATSGGSTMFAVLNSSISVENLLKGVIIQSANDGSIALAEGIAGSEAALAEMMNRRARDIGMKRSHFTNATGLPDPKMRTSVRDLARLSQHLIATYPEFYKWYGEREFTWNKIRQQNRNPLLTMNIGADGLKTGFTKESGYNLAASAVQDDIRLIAVLSGAKTANERADETRKLLLWGFHNFELRPLFAQDQEIGEAKIFGGARGSVALTAIGGRPIFVMVPKQVTERLVARIVYQGPLRAPVTAGQPVGMLKVSRGNAVALEVPLVAAQSVETGSISSRAVDAVGELFGNILRAGLKKL